MWSAPQCYICGSTSSKHLISSLLISRLCYTTMRCVEIVILCHRENIWKQGRLHDVYLIGYRCCWVDILHDISAAKEKSFVAFTKHFSYCRFYCQLCPKHLKELLEIHVASIYFLYFLYGYRSKACTTCNDICLRIMPLLYCVIIIFISWAVLSGNIWYFPQKDDDVILLYKILDILFLEFVL